MLRIIDLHVSFRTYGGSVQAVRGVNVDVYEKETLAIVGESGCGKSVTSQSIMRLLPAYSAQVDQGKFGLVIATCCHYLKKTCAASVVSISP